MRRTWVRWRLVALVLVVIAATTGCWQIAPLDQRGLVSILAIDTAPSGGYEVTAAVIQPPGLAPPGPAAGGGNSSQGPVYLRHALGPTVARALQTLGQMSYLSLDFTHLEAVVVSEAVARQGLGPAVQPIAQSPRFSATGWLLVARAGTAASLLQAIQKDAPRPSEVLSETVRSSRSDTPYRTSRLATAFKEMAIRGASFATAGVEAGTSSSSQTVPVVVSGVALFRRDRLVGWLTGPAALGWAVAMGRMSETTVAVPFRGATLDLDLIGAQRRVRVVSAGVAMPRVRIALRVSAHVVAAGQANFWRDPGAIQAVQGAAARTLDQDVTAALQQAQALGSDPFEIGEFVRLQDPAYWYRVRSHWAGGAFPHVPLRTQGAGKY
jgi:spore germination protein KC